ncbi:hypothetical protein ES703_57626 [subsurface metagenome]
MDIHARLVVRSGAEKLAFGSGYGGVARDERGSHAAQCLNAHGKRGNIEQQDFLHLTLEHTGLNRGPDGHDLIRVYALVRLLVKELLHLVLHQWHSGLPADDDNLIDLSGRLAGIFQRLLAWPQGFLHQVHNQLLQLGPRERVVQVFRAAGISGDEGQVDFCLLDRGEFGFRPLRRFLQALQCHLVLPEVDSLVTLELIAEPVHDSLVKIITTEVSIAGG